MNSPEHDFGSLAQFVELIGRYPATLDWMYRGQADITWALRPKAGRPEFYLKATDYWVKRGQSSGDLGRFGVWRDQAVGFCEHLPGNDFECLAYAQHYGLATRLLDWSSNPLVALFFAVETSSEVDGAVYCYFAERVIVSEQTTPERCLEVAKYFPRPFDRRIMAQGGLFTFHPKPEVPLQPEPVPDRRLAPEGSNLDVIRVRAEVKTMLQRQLADVGISRMALFPDLEGLSGFTNWKTRRIRCGLL